MGQTKANEASNLERIKRKFDVRGTVYSAHYGGAVAGMLFALAPKLRRLLRRPLNLSAPANAFRAHTRQPRKLPAIRIFPRRPIKLVTPPEKARSQ
jgi:hypothetical protein